MSGGLSGASAIVTGGGSGIGEAIAHRLRREGARVGVFDLRPARDDEHDHFQVNVTDDPAVREAVDDFASRVGGIDIVVNNAGIGARGTIEDNPDEEWSRSLTSTFSGLCAFRELRSHGSANLNEHPSSMSARLPPRLASRRGRSTEQARERYWP